MKGEALTEKQYRQLSALSSSSLREYVKNKKRFYKEYVLGEPREDEDSRAALIGSLVHTKLLEPEECFDERYHLTRLEKTPTGKMKEFVDALYKHTCEAMNEEGVVTKNFLELAELAYADSTFEWKLEAVIKKFSGSNAEEYYQQLREAKSSGKTVVTVDDITIAEKIVERTKTDPFVGYFFEDTEGMNELKIESFDIEGLELKAMVDKVIAGDGNKVLYPIDLKVVYDNQNFLRDYYYKTYAYIQAYVYWEALKHYFKTAYDGAYADWEIAPPIFVAVDSTCFYAPLRYVLTEKDMEDAYNGFEINGRVYPGVKEIIQDIQWAQENNIWNMSRIDFMNQGIRQL